MTTSTTIELMSAELLVSWSSAATLANFTGQALRVESHVSAVKSAELIK